MTVEKNTNEVFSHLDTIPPIPKNIENFLLDWYIQRDHLWTLSNHFEWLMEKYSSNEEVVLAASEIIVKINNIMTLWDWRKKQLAIHEAANDYSNNITV